MNIYHEYHSLIVKRNHTLAVFVNKPIQTEPLIRMLRAQLNRFITFNSSYFFDLEYGAHISANFIVTLCNVNSELR